MKSGPQWTFQNLADEVERHSVVFCATSEVPGASQGTMALKRINKELQVPTRRQLLEIMDVRAAK